MGGTPLLHLLLFSSAIFLVVAQTDFLSIDCGAAKAYVDADTGIQWVPDGSYIDSGLNSNVVNQNVLQSLRTLRYFPNSSASNCYVLPINSGQKYFLRAIFYYGNYDSKNSLPSFYLSFAGNEWTYEVVGSNWKVDDAFYQELIFPARQTTSINLCFTTADWVNSVPFISSLELRPLPADYYAQETVFANAYLHTLTRKYFNQEDYAVVRYDQDKIDRLWIATATVPDYANRINFTTTINTTGMWNMPPPEVLATALEGKPGYNFNYSVNLGEINSSLLFYFYFWELRSDRNATDVREFNMFVSSDSGERTDPLTLNVGPNGTGNWAAAFWGNFGTTKSVSFSLIPTSNSTLQPILNAYEIFAYNEPPVALPLPSPPPPSPSHPPPPPSPSPPPPHPPQPRPGSGSGSALRSNTLFLTIVFGVLNFYIMLF